LGGLVYTDLDAARQHIRIAIQMGRDVMQQLVAEGLMTEMEEMCNLITKLEHASTSLHPPATLDQAIVDAEALFFKIVILRGQKRWGALERQGDSNDSLQALFENIRRDDRRSGVPRPAPPSSALRSTGPSAYSSIPERYAASRVAPAGPTASSTSRSLSKAHSDLFAAADTNGDGVLTQGEFHNLVVGLSNF